MDKASAVAAVLTKFCIGDRVRCIDRYFGPVERRSLNHDLINNTICDLQQPFRGTLTGVGTIVGFGTTGGYGTNAALVRFPKDWEFYIPCEYIEHVVDG